ncbi:two-partner secretion domain-containing protein [Falsiroseomonas selenitidurans]|uniref:Filamentous hemagglutinin N-terminal domain-containing protein n=1 Tax=Falsiroseomonas selenitidurans TaxID=2716335 RepID=A0ABX1E792_9PROT|nr:filamentous hemagglutinin N-terminal domain-containing protein [Falsiroseomonas selenitidurans]NKC32838.1 filamentous hemagglutinin N-terminal domain-containing protein [Falsiroseomonas selenitidurans]
MRARLLATSALLPVLAAAPALAQAPNAAPSGGQVVAGAASISRTATTTTIDQASQRAAIDWRGFDVGANQAVRFNQPSSAAWTLNRVNSPDPSLIAGRITANGGIAIVNQSGVVFAPGAQVNVGSLIASAANITTQNFMAGRMVFDGAPRPGARVENHGRITVADRGLATLVAPGVANAGVIQARLGRVALAGAETFTLDLAGDGLVSLDVTQAVRQAPGGGVALVTNSGLIEAAGGTVLLTAEAARGVVDTVLRNTGRISTDAAGGGGQVALRAVGGEARIDAGHISADASAGRGGQIAATAPGGAVVVAQPARLSASGAAGGGTVQLGGATTQRVSVAGIVAAAGTGAAVRGGLVAVQGKTLVALEAGAKLDASAPGGGGTILAGSTGRGRDGALAATTRIAAGASLTADATAAGQGGSIVINSLSETAMQGALSARGGAAGGDGGFIEISGQAALAIAGTVDLRAPAGANGTLLFDPLAIEVVAVQPDAGDLGPEDANQAGGAALIQANTDAGGTLFVLNTDINGFAANMTLEAVNGITVSAAINKAAGDLTLTAGGAIALNAPVTLDAAATLNLRSDGAVTQTGIITAGTLDVRGATGAEAGAITLDLANQVASFAAASSAGISFRSALAGGLTVTGATAAADSTLQGDARLALSGDVDVGAANRLDLRSDGGVTQAGIITASLVDVRGATGAAAAAIALDQQNQVANFSATASAGVAFRSSLAAGLAVTGVTAAGDSTLQGDNALALTGAIDVGAANRLDLRSDGAVTQAGILTAGTLDVRGATVSAAASVALGLANQVGTVEGLADGDLTLRSAAAGGLTVTNATAGGSLALTADAGLSLSGTAEGTGGVTLTAETLSLAGPVRSGANADVTLVTDTLTVTAGAALRAGTAGNGGTLAIGPRSTGRDIRLGGAGAPADTLTIGDDVLAVIDPLTARLLVNGGTTSALRAVSALDFDALGVEQVELRGASIAVEAALRATTGLTLVAQNDVTQTAAGLLTTNSLAATSNAGSVLLATASPLNAVGAVSGSAATDFTFGGTLALAAGPVTATAGAVTLGAPGITLAGAVAAGTDATLTSSAAIALDAALTAGATARLRADGAVTQTGIVTAATLDIAGASGAASGAVTLALANQVGSFIAVSSAGVDFRSAIAGGLTVTGMTAAADSTLRGDTSLALSGAVDVAANGLDLRSDGAVTQAGVITAGALDVRGASGATAGAITLGLANLVTGFAAASSGDVTFNAAGALGVTGVVAGGTAALTAGGTMTVTGDVTGSDGVTLTARALDIQALVGSGADAGVTLVTDSLVSSGTGAFRAGLGADGGTLEIGPRTAGRAIQLGGDSGAPPADTLVVGSDSIGRIAADTATLLLNGAGTSAVRVAGAADLAAQGVEQVELRGATIAVEAALSAAEDLLLRADGVVTQTALLTADTLAVRGATGAAADAVTLDLANDIGSFAAVSSAGVDFRSAGAGGLSVTGLTAVTDSRLRGDVSLALTGAAAVGAATLDLRSDGAVTQGAALTAGTLDVRGATGAAAGAVTLDLANQVGSFAADSSAGVNFRSTLALEVTGVTAAADSTLRGDPSLVLSGAVDVGAASRLDLRTDGPVTQTAALTAGTLDVRGATGAAAGAIALELANSVGSFAAASSAGVGFRSTLALDVTGVTAAADSTLRGDPSLVLSGVVDVGAANRLDLRSDGAVTQTAIITADTLDVRNADGSAAAGAITLDLANEVGHFAAASAAGVSFRSALAAGLDVTGVTAAADSTLRGDTALAPSGAVDVGAANRLDLRSDGAVTQTAIITAETLDVRGATGAAAGAVTLGLANQVGRFAAVSSAAVSFRSALAAGLEVTGVTAAGDSALRGDAALALSGAVDVGAANALDLRSDGAVTQAAILTADTLDVRSADGSAAAGAITLELANQVAGFAATSSGGVAFRSARPGGLTATQVEAGAALALTADATLASTGTILSTGSTVTLAGAAGVTQSAGSIAGSGAVALTASAGAVATAGSVTSGAGVTLAGSTGVTQSAGSIAGSGAVALIASAGSVTADASISSTTSGVALSGQSGVAQAATGIITAADAVALTASGGAVATAGSVSSSGAGVALEGSTGVTQSAGSIAGSGAVALTASGGAVATAGSVSSSGAGVTLAGSTGVTQSAGSIAGSGAVALTASAGRVDAAATVTSSGAGITLSGQAGVGQAASGIVTAADAVALTASGGVVATAGSVASTGAGVSLAGASGVTQSAGSIQGADAVALTASGGVVATAGSVASTGAGVSLAGASGVTQSAGSIAGSGAVALTASGGVVATAGSVASTGAGVSLSGASGVTQSAGSIQGAGAVALVSSTGGVVADASLRSTAAGVALSGQTGVTQAAGGSVAAVDAVSLAAAGGAVTTAGTVQSSGAGVALSSQSGVTQSGGSIAGAEAVALTASGGAVSTAGTVQSSNAGVSLTGQAGVTQSGGSITGSGAVVLTASGGAVSTAGTVQSSGAGVAVSGQSGVTQSGGSIGGSGAVAVTAAGGAVAIAGSVQSTGAAVDLSGQSGTLASGGSVRGAGAVAFTATSGAVSTAGTVVSDTANVVLNAAGDITQGGGRIAAAGTVELVSKGAISATAGRIEAAILRAEGGSIDIGRFSSDPSSPTHALIVREMQASRATAGRALIELQGLADGTETVVSGPQTATQGYTLRSTGNLLLRDAAVQAGSGDARIQADGFLRLDPGSSVTAPGVVRLAAGQSTALAQALSLEGVALQGNQLELVVGQAGRSDGRVVVVSSEIRAGTSVLFAAGGSVATSDVAVVQTDLARLPLVIYDTRRSGTAFRATPGAVTDATADRPGLQAVQQPWQVRASDTPVGALVFGVDDGGSGAASAAAAGTVTLLLDAGDSPVLLMLDGGTASGVLTAGRLGVHGLPGTERAAGDNVVSLSGQLNRVEAGIAAQFGRSTARAAADEVRYRFNECVIGAVNCAGTSLAQPFVVPLDTRIDIRRDRPRLDPDVLLPNIAEEDY